LYYLNSQSLISQREKSLFVTFLTFFVTKVTSLILKVTGSFAAPLNFSTLANLPLFSGVALGSMISGWLYAAAGGSLTFAVFSAGSLICCFAHLGVHCSNKQAQYSTDSDGKYSSYFLKSCTK